ncbi:peptidoglycan DD-metalloendopeptidase family protein [Streptomyces sp. NPDC051569]|uniref:M23 family metallopeptidase n=1 Tax=Streptomyces sp. NPDC051569 TaxID=3365661 RepID=UPI0037B3AE41
MPVQGKHRRTKANPIARGLIAVGAGGAVIALPLIGATGAHAAETAAPQTATTAERTASPAKSVVKHAAAETVRTYSVVSGDYLSKIAQEQNVRGGWHKLYNDNRRAIGANPSLIHPGLKLTLGAKAGAAHHHVAPAPAKPHAQSKPQAAAPAKPEVKAPQAAPAAQTQAPTAQTQAPAAQPAAPAQSSGSGFTAPVSGVGIGTSYHASGSSWASGYHTGVDFLASSGTVVKAVGPGTVVSAGWAGSYGNQVVIQHGDGRYSQYAHLSSLAVSAGQTVSGGQQIGLSGSTGNSTGPHLHFEIRTGPDYGSDIDPLAYLRGHGVSI